MFVQSNPIPGGDDDLPGGGTRKIGGGGGGQPPTNMQGASSSQAQVASRVRRIPLAGLGTSTSTDYAETFFKAHPLLRGMVWVHHAIPQTVLTRYRGIISTSQMHSLQNLRGIPNAINSTLHLSTIARSWNRFYRTHSTTTVTELRVQATLIDLRYGHLFDPPSQP